MMLDTVVNIVAAQHQSGLLRRALTGFQPRPATGSESGIELAIDVRQGVLGRDETRGAWLSSALADINRAVIEHTRLFAVHAAVVGDRASTVAIVAPSGGGKSTLAAALVMEGLGYGSDEALCLDDQGFVAPYPRPIGLSRWSCQALGLPATGAESFFSPADLGGMILPEGRRVSQLLLPARTAGSQQGPSLEALPASAAMAALIENSFNHYRNPERAFALAAQVAESAPAYRLTVSDPVVTARFVVDRLLS